MEFKVPANEWYGDEAAVLEFPDGWTVQEQRMAGSPSSQTPSASRS